MAFLPLCPPHPPLSLLSCSFLLLRLLPISEIRSLTPAQQEEYARISASLREVKGEIRRMTSVFPPVLRNYASDSVEVSLLKAFDEKDFSPLSFPSTRQMPFFAGKEAHSWLDVRDSLKQTGACKFSTFSSSSSS